MRWLCFLLVSPALAQARPAKPLHFDLTAIPATRDSFVFMLDRKPRGYAIWQYETRATETTQQVIYTSHSELTPVEEESLHVVMDRLSGMPLESFQHIDFYLPRRDTVMIEHDLAVKQGRVEGRRKVQLRGKDETIVPIDAPLPAGAVWSNYALYAAAVTNAAPGDSLTAIAYEEFSGAPTLVSFVAEQPTTIRVPAGQFQVLPLRSGNFRLHVTTQAPRRVVRGATLDGRFRFDLAHSGPVVSSAP
jgi:hypothetical protein